MMGIVKGLKGLLLLHLVIVKDVHVIMTLFLGQNAHMPRWLVLLSPLSFLEVPVLAAYKHFFFGISCQDLSDISACHYARTMSPRVMLMQVSANQGHAWIMNMEVVLPNMEMPMVIGLLFLP